MCGRAVVGAILILSIQLLVAQSRPGRSQDRRRLPEYYRAFESRWEEGPLARVVLRNGLKIIVEEQVAAPLVAVTTFVQFGALDTDASTVLPAILTELVGTRLAEAIHQSGGTSRIESAPSYTLYSTMVADRNVLRALEAHASLLDPVEASDQQLQFLRDWVLQKNDGGEWATTEAAPNEDSPAGDLAVSLKAIKTIHGSFYHPHNVILSISGSLRREQVLRKVVELFASRSSTETATRGKLAARRQSPNELNAGFRYRIERGLYSAACATLEYGVPGWLHSDAAALRLLSYALGQGVAALGRISPGEDRAPPFQFEVRLVTLPVGRTFQIQLVPQKGELDQSELAMLGLLEALSQEGLPPVELDRARALWLKDHYQRLERLDLRAKDLALHEISGDLRRRTELAQDMLKLSTEDVDRVLKRYFQQDNLVLTEYLPHEEERTFTQESYQDTLDILLESHVQKHRDFLRALSSEADRPQLQLPPFRPSYQKTDLRRTAILRGPDIFLRERHLVPLVTVGVFFSGGRIKENAQTAGVTELMLHSLLKNRQRLEGGLFLHRLQRRGVDFQLINEPDFFGVRITALSNALEMLVARIIGWLRNPQFDENDFESARRDLLTLLAGEPSTARQMLGQQVRSQVFGEHPYALKAEGNSASISALTHAQVQDWAEQELRSVHPYLIVLGDTDGTAFLKSLISELSDRRYQVRDKVELRFRPNDDFGYGSLSRGGRLIMDFPAPELGSYSARILPVMEWMLGGLGGRLSRALRQQQLSNRAKVRLELQPNGGLLRISAWSARPEMAEALKQAVLDELKAFSDGAIPRGEFLNALVGIMTYTYSKAEDNESFLLEVMRNILAGSKPSYQQDFLRDVRNLSPGELAAGAERTFIIDQ